MVLTTARDEQDRAEITFCRGEGEGSGISLPEQLATLSLDDLEPRERGEPDIDLELELDDAGRLEATATERSTGRRERLSIFVNDSALDDPYRVPASLSDSDLFEEREEDYHPGAGGRSLTPLWIVLLLIFLASLGWVLYRYVLTPAAAPTQPAPAVSESTEPAPEAPVDETPAAEPPAAVAEPPAVVEEPPAAVAEPTHVEPPAAVEESPPPDEVSHSIIRGDTLWDISKRYYGTPWLFPEIAERNLIRNPDLIFANDDIVLPDRRYLER